MALASPIQPNALSGPSTKPIPSKANWDRVCTLSLSGAGGSTGSRVFRYSESEGLSLSMDFEIESHTLQSPALACFVLKNVSTATAAKVQKEFTEVVFTAGYRGREGELFRGTIVETQYGEKVDNFTTMLLRIWCACSDLAYNGGRVNTSLPAGATHQDVVGACLKAMRAAQPNLTMGPVVGVNLSGFRFPRGQVLAGLARDYLRETCFSLGATWTLSGNKLSILAKDAPGIGSSNVVLSSGTGGTSQPIQRVEGVIVECLINPAIQINTTVKIVSKIISPQVTGNAIVPGSIDRQTQLANQTNTNGEYRVLHIVTRGSTRGNDWTMRLTTIGVGQNLNTTQAGLGYS